MPKGNLAMLVGNGLSIAFSDELMLGNISSEVTERLTSIYGNQGGDVAKAMQKVAAHARTGDPITDFESLIGAFGGHSDILRDLTTFANLTENSSEITDEIKRVREFVGAVQRKGIGHTLEIIVERSYSDLVSRKPLNDFFALVRSVFSSAITVANLNYDTLVLSVLSEDYGSSFCDLARGGATSSAEINLTGSPHNIYELRPDASDMPEQSWKPIRLLHLHGSATFWNIKGSSVKVEIPTTRNESVWQRFRDGDLKAHPLVVLANQHDKADHVRRYPFNVAYELAEDDFRSSDSWLIVGYSFRDVCVNDLLKRCWDSSFSKPRILIVTKGQDLISGDIENALGLDHEAISNYPIDIERDGVVGLEERGPWKWFVDEPNPS